MSALQKSQRVFSGIGYVGNFLNTGVKVGDIYQLDDRQFILLANITDLASELKLDTSKLSVGTMGNLKYTKESNVEVKFNGDASAPNLVKGEIQLNFKSRNSAFISLKDTVTTEIKMELIRESLKQVWLDKKYKKNGRHVLVSQIVEAASGTVIFSQERNNKVVLKATADEAITSIAKMGTGQLEFVLNTKATLESISTIPYTPLFKALYLKTNGNFEML